jgi:HK97 family phage portal protein
LLPGRGGVGQLSPLSPTTTRVVDQLPDGRLLYVTRPVFANGRFGAERRLTQDEVLHLRGLSLDGRSGLPLSNVARNAMGLALAAERHGSMFLRKGARFAGVLSTSATMIEETRRENEAAWQRAFGGSDASGGTPILTGDMKYTPITSNNKDTQWLESRTFQVEELLRFIGVPGVLCGYADKTATYASAEQFFLSFVTYTVMPDTVDIAAELNATVVTQHPEYFADFILNGLLRGDIKTRYEAYRSAITTGWMSRNEARVTEDLNRGPEELDQYLEPLNMVNAGEERDGANKPRPSTSQTDNADEEDDAGEQARLARLSAIAQRVVEQLVGDEVAAIAGTAGRKGIAARFAADRDRWGTALQEFYDRHAPRVAELLGVDVAAAREYTDAQRERLATGIPAHFHQASVAAMAALLEDPSE